MKELVLTAMSCFVISFSYAQNVFPASGNVGIGTATPISLFQVNGYASKTSIGDASGAALAYGTSYIGFNAGRNSTGWTLNQDGANNGGAVIYSSIFGDIYFCSVETTGASDKILSDAEMRSRTQFHIGTDGTAYAKAIKVQTTGWPDYVFSKQYELPTLRETEKYIKENGHLPGVPTAAEVAKDGIELGDLNAKLLKKIEELTLHMIMLEKNNEKQQKEIDSLKSGKK